MVPPPSDPKQNQRLAIALLQTADAVRRTFSRVVEAHGLTLQQFNVLRILRGAKGPLPTMTIGERLIEQTPGLTRLLDRLEDKGLVERHRCREDRRQVLCAITPAGLALLADLDAPMAATDEAAFEMLPAEERVRLLRLLTRVHDAHLAAQPVETSPSSPAPVA